MKDEDEEKRLKEAVKKCESARYTTQYTEIRRLGRAVYPRLCSNVAHQRG
jgi:hypothetical protein